MELSIPERLKDLCVERGLMLEQLAEKTRLSKSTLGAYCRLLPAACFTVCFRPLVCRGYLKKCDGNR